MNKPARPKPPFRYWWSSDLEERFWVEIRYVEGLGKDLRCPIRDKDGNSNPWYDLVESVRPGDVIYHWNAIQNGFVGVSEVAGEGIVSGDERSVPLRDFRSTERIVLLADVRAKEAEILEVRERIRDSYPGFGAYYLPFQFRNDGLRMMSNYFAKLPKELVKVLFSAETPGTEFEPHLDLAGSQHSRMAYLQPFKGKSDSDYIARIAPRQERRSRSHETLVNALANWLEEKGFQPARNQAVDIGLERPSVIFEAKTIRTGWALAIRQAVGQLYEYRYFGISSPETALVFVAPCPIPAHWQAYLERDRDIACAWLEGSDFTLSDRAAALLGLG